MKPPLKVEIARELASELPGPALDLGLRAGVDALHPLYRSVVATSFATWNILDIWSHKDIKVATMHALNELNECSGASRYLGGLSTIHATCEARSAQFLAGEAALLFGSKNQAILTLVTALATGGGVVIGPAMSSLPLADACALVDLEFVECETTGEYLQSLERHHNASRILLVAETVSATKGRRIDLSPFIAALSTHNAWVVLDESTAIAHSGLRGAGSAETFPASPKLLARIVSAQVLSAGQITALVCPQEVRELLTQRSRYLRIEPPPSAVEVASFSASLDLCEVALTNREKLAARSRLVQAATREQGWHVVSDDDLPIVALWFDTYRQARGIQEALLQRGIVVDALPARSLRNNGAVVRIILSSGHTDLEVTHLLDSLLEVRKRLLGQIDSSAG